MPTPLRIDVSHQLGRAEARRRIASGFTTLANQLPGGPRVGEARWDGDRMSFSITAMAQVISGSVEVFDTSVRIDIALPGLLGPIAGAVAGRLRQAGRLLLAGR